MLRLSESNTYGPSAERYDFGAHSFILLIVFHTGISRVVLALEASSGR